MSTVIQFSEQAKAHFLGTRYSARALRDRLERALADSDEVILNFDSVAATQSFIDELLGVLVLRSGPDIIKRMVFKGCSRDVREIIKFVVNSRANDYMEMKSH